MSDPDETKLVVALVSGSHFVFHSYLVLLSPILTVLSTEFGVTVGTLGLAMGAIGVTNITLQLPYGHLSDTRSRTLALALSLGFATTGAAIVAAAPSFAALVVGQVVLGAGVAGHHPAHFPLLADATAERHRGRAFSVHGFAGSLGFAAPPALVAAVLGVPGLSWRHAVGLLAAVGAAFTLVAVPVLHWRVADDVTLPPPARDRANSSSPAGDGSGLAGTPADPLRIRAATAIRTALTRARAAAREQLRVLAASPAVLALSVLALVTSVASWGVTTYAVVLLHEGYAVAVPTANLALTGLFVVGAVAILLGGALTDRLSPGPVLVAGYGLVTVLLAVVATTAIPAAVAVACVVLVGGARSVSGPARSKLADDVSAREDLGQTFAVVTVGIMLGGAVAPPLFGWVVENGTPQGTFAAIAAVALLATVLSVVIVRRFGPERADVGRPVAGDD